MLRIVILHKSMTARQSFYKKRIQGSIKHLKKSGAFIMPSNIQISVLPCRVLSRNFGLGGKLLCAERGYYTVSFLKPQAFTLESVADLGLWEGGSNIKIWRAIFLRAPELVPPRPPLCQPHPFYHSYNYLIIVTVSVSLARLTFPLTSTTSHNY